MKINNTRMVFYDSMSVFTKVSLDYCPRQVYRWFHSTNLLVHPYTFTAGFVNPQDKKLHFLEMPFMDNFKDQVLYTLLEKDAHLMSKNNINIVSGAITVDGLHTYHWFRKQPSIEGLILNTDASPESTPRNYFNDWSDVTTSVFKETVSSAQKKVPVRIFCINNTSTIALEFSNGNDHYIYLWPNHQYDENLRTRLMRDVIPKLLPAMTISREYPSFQPEIPVFMRL